MGWKGKDAGGRAQRPSGEVEAKWVDPLAVAYRVQQ